jgi:hypothetical protein
VRLKRLNNQCKSVVVTVVQCRLRTYSFIHNISISQHYCTIRRVCLDPRLLNQLYVGGKKAIVRTPNFDARRTRRRGVNHAQRQRAGRAQVTRSTGRAAQSVKRTVAVSPDKDRSTRTGREEVAAVGLVNTARGRMM